MQVRLVSLISGCLACCRKKYLNTIQDDKTKKAVCKRIACGDCKLADSALVNEAIDFCIKVGNFLCLALFMMRLCRTSVSITSAWVVTARGRGGPRWVVTVWGRPQMGK